MPELKIGLAYVSALNFDQSFLQFNAKKKINAKKSSRFEFKCWILKTGSLNIDVESSLYEACLPLTLTWVKLNVRPELSTEPTHFLTLMHNGVECFSLDVMSYSYHCSDQFQFLPGHWQVKVLDFLRP